MAMPSGFSSLEQYKSVLYGSSSPPPVSPRNVTHPPVPTPPPMIIQTAVPIVPQSTIISVPTYATSTYMAPATSTYMAPAPLPPPAKPEMFEMSDEPYSAEASTCGKGKKKKSMMKGSQWGEHTAAEESFVSSTWGHQSEWKRLQWGFFADHGYKREEAWKAGPVVKCRYSGPLVDLREVVQSERKALGLDSEREKVQEGTKPTALEVQRSLWQAVANIHRDICEDSGGQPTILIRARTRKQTKNEMKKVEREQRKKINDREEARKKRLKTYLNAITAHREEFLKFHRNKISSCRASAVGVKKYLENKERKAEKDKDSEEKARMAALAKNDMNEYIRLVAETKNERLNYLLEQTDQFIQSIGDKIKDQRLAAGFIEEEIKDSEVVDAGMSSHAKQYYKDSHRKFEEVVQPRMLKGGDLKEYQLAGLQWMVSLYNNNLNGILADEMGLGKTIQSISLITYVMEVKVNMGPFLIVVPLSTMSNWVNEFEKWAPEVIVVQYKGNPDERKIIQKEEMESGQYNVLLTTYDFVMKDKATLKKTEWEYIIVDEGHRMKNAESKFALTLGTYYSSKRRILLTGTPLQNNLPELWALLNFLLPDIFASQDSFDQWFSKPFTSFGGQEEREKNMSLTDEEKMLIIKRLHELLRPFMLRRVKSAVMGQLPNKVEKVLKCSLSGYQRFLYHQIMNKNRLKATKKTTMNNILMHLRMCCNHPFLLQDEYVINEGLVAYSGKFELLDRILPKLKAAGHRILLFSQFTGVIDILEDYFHLRAYRYLRLDGKTSADERESRMFQFNQPDSPYFIFALSTRAGGLGLNLATADTVIFLDSDWNPSVDSQAMDRAHRIGQRNDVRVFRLITDTNVEERILSKANEKSKLTNLVVEAGKFNKDAKESERRKMMESLLADREDTEESTVPDDEQLNEMMATNKEELELYKEMDRIREEQELQAWLERRAVDKNAKREPRLSEVVPDYSKYAKVEVKEDAIEDENGEPVKRKRAGTDGVTYSDKLTDRQFLKAEEDKAAEEEQVKKARKLSRTPPLAAEAYKAMNAVYNKIRRVKEDGEVISEIFLDKPSRKAYPDYYTRIKEPMALRIIRNRIRKQEYRKMEAFARDFRLMFNNATTYNKDDCLAYQWAERLLEIFEAEYAIIEQKYGHLGPGQPVAKKGGRPPGTTKVVMDQRPDEPPKKRGRKKKETLQPDMALVMPGL